MVSTTFFDQYISARDVVAVCLFGLLIAAIAFYRSLKLENEKLKLNYRLNVAHKIVFAFVYGIYYVFIFQGGDTTAYWHTSGVLLNVLKYDVGQFFELITTPPSYNGMYSFFNAETGYPLRFIYMEPESFFVGIVFVAIRFISFESYFASTLILAFWMANASWKLYKVCLDLDYFEKRTIALFCLFLPSVAFWTSGVSKDTIVYISLLNLVYYSYHIFLKQQLKAGYIIGAIFYLAFVYFSRPFILAALLIPLGFMVITKLVNSIKDFDFLRRSLKIIVYSSILFGLLLSLLFYSGSLLEENSSIQEAKLIQEDFELNTEIYGDEEGKRYSLGEIEYTPVGLLRSVPDVLLAGIYRPFIWEALNPSLFLNGIESLILIFFTLRLLISRKVIQRLSFISNSPTLSFALIFVFIIAFMAGFTSILFGVLVRIRAPILPFLGMLLAIDWGSVLSKEEDTAHRLDKSL